MLSKLGWNLELVTACDYLSPLAYLVTLSEEHEEELEEVRDGEDAKSALVANGELVSGIEHLETTVGVNLGFLCA